MSIPTHVYLVMGCKDPLYAMNATDRERVVTHAVFLSEREAQDEAAKRRASVFSRLAGPAHAEHFVDRMLAYRKTIKVVKVSVGNPVAHLVAEEIRQADA